MIEIRQTEHYARWFASLRDREARARGVIVTKPKLTKWDPADHLRTEADIVAYLEAALEDGDPSVISAALGDIARAKGMSEVAREAGLGRESLYKALATNGNPGFATILKVIRALGLRLHAAPER